MMTTMPNRLEGQTGKKIDKIISSASGDVASNEPALEVVCPIFAPISLLV